MKIYVYAEHTILAGRVFQPNELYSDDDDLSQDDSVFQWGEGTEEELRLYAEMRLSCGNVFTRKCAANVLEFLG